MGRRGPAPHPTKLRLLHGERGYRINDAEPVPAAGEVSAPAGLPARVRGIFDATLAELAAMELVTRADTDALVAYAAVVDAVRRTTEAFDISGPVILDPQTGRILRSPVLGLMLQASAEQRAWAREFGLTPAARQPLRVEVTHHEAGGAERLLTGRR